MSERKDVNVYAVPARVGVRAPLPYRKLGLMDVIKESFLHDPERPHMGPNELWEEIKDDPSGLLVGCHSCGKEMPVPLFLAHLWDNKEGMGCIRKWHNTMDVTNRKFSGASMGETSE